jgi:hypothetical protein
MEQSFGIFESLSQYGALGIITLALGAALWYLLKRQLASEDALKAKVETLQTEINTYIRTDQNRVSDVIENNTRAFQELRDLILLNKNSR